VFISGGGLNPCRGHLRVEAASFRDLHLVLKPKGFVETEEPARRRWLIWAVSLGPFQIRQGDI